MGRPKLARRAIHATIRSRRLHLKLSMQDLADRVGVTKTAISRWESAGDLSYAPSISRLGKLAKALGVEAADLLEDLVP